MTSQTTYGITEVPAPLDDQVAFVDDEACELAILRNLVQDSSDEPTVLLLLRGDIEYPRRVRTRDKALRGPIRGADIKWYEKAAYVRSPCGHKPAHLGATSDPYADILTGWPAHVPSVCGYKSRLNEPSGMDISKKGNTIYSHVLGICA